jgi:chromosome segregation ATPase
MSKKSKTIEKITAANVELKKTLAGVRGQLTKTQSKLAKTTERADRWKKEAAAHRTAAARSDARAEKLQKKLDRATAALKPAPSTKAQKAATTGDSNSEPSTAYGLTAPDETWTVVQLRAEAHARGLTGMSDKTKEQLLTALT